jgi:CRP-like cAMP-binding protein
MSLLTGDVCSATATTLTPTTVFAATPQEFYGLLADVPSFAARVVETATTRAASSATSPPVPQLTH